jgi:hypothetical protein
MRRVLSIFTVFVCYCSVGLVLGAPPVAAQVYGVLSPSSRTAAQSGAAVTLSGWVLTAGQSITIAAVDQNTGKTQTLGVVTASNSGKTYNPIRCHVSHHDIVCRHYDYTLYPWSYTSASPLPANYWAPQLSFAAGLPTSQGHLELFALVGGVNLPTFSADALESMQQLPLYTSDPALAAGRFSDGNSTVLFDQYGVGGVPASWTTVAGMVSNPPPSPLPNTNYPSVAWSVGSYNVGAANSGITIYALICAPNQNGNFPLVIYNHGGINYGRNSMGVDNDIGSLHGNVTSTGWTSAPASGGDDLGQCIDWAKRGWIFAMSSYRAESIAITSASPAFATNTWQSNSTNTNGSSEFCMGEVTDVMALVDILVNHIGNVTLGNPNNPSQQLHITTSFDQSNPTTAWNGQLFMFGYSHGGCITYRAVEQGAPVNAFAVIEGFTDISLGYLNGLAACNIMHMSDPTACTVPGPGGTTVYDPTAFAAAGSGAVDSTGTVLYYPDGTGVMGYNWRSAHYFASRGDLGILKFKTMPILILHGDIDLGNPVPLDEPAEFAPDINATDIFYGPNGSAPPSQACIASGFTGAAIADPNTHQPLSGVQSSCAVPFTTMGAGDACLGANPAPGALPTNFGASGPCTVMLLPLSPQQLHYLVVYHNMDHFNGGSGIASQFGRFVQQNFGSKPGCDGIPVSAPAALPLYSVPIACNGLN